MVITTRLTGELIIFFSGASVEQILSLIVGMVTLAVSRVVAHHVILNQMYLVEGSGFYASKIPAIRFRKENAAVKPAVMSTARVITGLSLFDISSKSIAPQKMIAAYMKSSVRDEEVQTVGEKPIMTRVIKPNSKIPPASNPRR